MRPWLPLSLIVLASCRQEYVGGWGVEVTESFQSNALDVWTSTPAEAVVSRVCERLSGAESSERGTKGRHRIEATIEQTEYVVVVRELGEAQTKVRVSAKRYMFYHQEGATELLDDIVPPEERTEPPTPAR